MHFLASAFVFAVSGVSGPSPEVSESFEKVAVAATSFQTCEQLGFSVDRQGISDWISSAQASAIAAGMREDEANAELNKVVDFKWQRILDRHARASLMQHSPDHVSRNNRHWLSRCEQLADDPSSSSYFSRPKT